MIEIYHCRDDLFGGFFDLDGDGHTDPGEEFLAFQLFEEMEKEEREQRELSDDDDELPW